VTSPTYGEFNTKRAELHSLQRTAFASLNHQYAEAERTKSQAALANFTQAMNDIHAQQQMLLQQQMFQNRLVTTNCTRILTRSIALIGDTFA
jgi:hypothetical protein